MEKEIRDIIVEAVIRELGNKKPILIHVSGESSGECDDFMRELSYRVDCVVTNRVFGGSGYCVDLDYFIDLYRGR